MVVSLAEHGTCSLVLIFRNGVSVEGATHKQVVDLIKSGGDDLTLTGKQILLNSLSYYLMVYINLRSLVFGY